MLPLGDYLSFGAAPIAEQGFFDQEVPEPVRSFRNSDHGYVNKEEIQVSFASLEDYVSAIENYIEQGDLIAERNFTRLFVSVDKRLIAPSLTRESPT